MPNMLKKYKHERLTWEITTFHVPKCTEKFLKTWKTNYVFPHLYSHVVKQNKLLLRPLTNQLISYYPQKKRSNYIFFKKIDSSGAKLLEYSARSTGNWFYGHKIKTIFSWKRIYSADEPQNTQSFLCRRRGDPKDSISYDHKMGNSSKAFRLSVEYTTGEQTPIADALSRTDFDVEESNNDRVCFAINTNYFARSDLMTQAQLKTEPGINKFFHNRPKRIISRNWKQCSEAEKRFDQKKDALTIYDESSSEVLFHSFHPNYDTWFWQKPMRHILGRLQQRHQSEW